jgi:hypothetical protein
MRTYARQKVVREAREKGIKKREKNAPKRKKKRSLEESYALQKCLQFLQFLRTVNSISAIPHSFFNATIISALCE